MKKLNVALGCAVSALVMGASVMAQPAAPDASPTRSSEAVAPDNAKSNKLDASNRTAVADKQTNATADLDLAKRVRQSVMADKELSTYGHNVKIVAVNGTVTLNGVVRNTEEKMQIGKKAQDIAGPGHVVDELKVAASK
ncbi:MAG TPA: BON domain-containing protein [Steroidobacteraceae bacterium]